MNPKTNIIFTLDYEIHGNGDGNPLDLMIKPTQRLMDLFSQYDAKLTIFADVAEILKFKEYQSMYSNDKFYVQEIEAQLKDAIRNGHDVQLHIHSSYFNAVYNGTRWEQDWSEYNLAELPLNRVSQFINDCKSYLESLLKPVDETYQCRVFRAANWSMMPTKNIATALIENGIYLDSSVYKWGMQSGNVEYDYTPAYSNSLPYRFNVENINVEDINGPITEYPIYSELRGSLPFINPARIYRMIRSKFHKHQIARELSTTNISRHRALSWRALFIKHAWKLDFSQASGRQMIGATRRVLQQSAHLKKDIPLVLIGHSKTILPYNIKNLRKYLKFLQNNENVNFSLFKMSDPGDSSN